MRIIITGATGFIGKPLSQELVRSGYEVIALSRNPQKSKDILGEAVKAVLWDGKSSSGLENYVEGAYAIINLTGENIGEGRWTRSKKEKIIESRLNAGKAIVEAVKQFKEKPKVIIQASGIGYYGSRGDEILDESSSNGYGFLPEVALKWEESTKETENYRIRHIIIRTGIVLGKGGGSLPRFIKPFGFFLGGPLGSGKQWFSWIHIKDEVGAIRFLLENRNSRGVFNLASPQSVRMKEFAKTLGKVMKRPAWLKVPGIILRILLGEMAEELILSGQRVVPKRLTEAGYQFAYSDLELSLKEILG